MLASIAWLKRYVDIDVTPEELADRLTRVGLEVESVIHQGAGARWITAAARSYRSRPAPRM